MIERLAYLWPEIILFATTCVVMVVGLSPNAAVRRSCAGISGLGLVFAGIAAWLTTPHGAGVTAASGQTLLPGLALYVKVVVAAVGLLMLLLLTGSIDREEEDRLARSGAPFDALRSNRAEFYSFFLFSLTGLMLCAGADDLVWLFLALELTSLPTYIMVVIGGGTPGGAHRSQEAGVKYFFLGALGAAVFLYGFALIYGGTGTTNLNRIHESVVAGGLNPIALTGFVLALLGMCFKIAAVPMHFYTADVYEGAAAPISAFLAFVPKTAGFVGIMLLTACMGWIWAPGAEFVPNAGLSLPEPVRLLLWVIAALTMTVGNVLAIWQNSVKRILAYSSIAHSGYMLVGIIAGPGDGTFSRSGLSAVLFYILCYGVMNVGCFAVLACLERRGKDGQPQEIETVDDLKGLCQTHPALGWTMALCSLSLLGFPPLLGFLAKVPLFTSAISAGEIPLVIVLGVNSAIAAFYYLRLFGAPVLEKAAEKTNVQLTPFMSRRVAGIVSAAAVVGLILVAGRLMNASRDGAASGGHTQHKAAQPATTPAQALAR